MSNEQPDPFGNPVSLQTCIWMLREALFAIDRNDVEDGREWIASLTRSLAKDESIYEWIEAKAERGELYVNQ